MTTAPSPAGTLAPPPAPRARRAERLPAVAPAPVTVTAPRFAQLALPATPANAPAARHWAGWMLGRWALSTPVLDDALLVIAELVANSVEHGGDEMTIGLSIADGLLCITVADNGAAQLPFAMPATFPSTAPDATAGPSAPDATADARAHAGNADPAAPAMPTGDVDTDAVLDALDALDDDEAFEALGALADCPERGRGLALVEALSVRCTMERPHPRGLRIQADLPLAA
jgi:anti-sigma regulatory factor (Ser/Thr protein kinase)